MVLLPLNPNLNYPKSKMTRTQNNSQVLTRSDPISTDFKNNNLKKKVQGISGFHDQAIETRLKISQNRKIPIQFPDSIRNIIKGIHPTTKLSP